jgi:hypothetical protein
MAQVDDEIAYIEIVNPIPEVQRVRKQLWDGSQWVETAHYRIPRQMTNRERDWLYATFGAPNVYRLGRFWSARHTANYTVMDEQVYMMYTLKWSQHDRN